MKKFLRVLKLKLSGGYNAKKYWESRHSEYGLDFRGVGNKALSKEENIIQYQQAKKIFCEIIDAGNIKLENANVLDIGCGNGFYANTYQELNVANYTGLDITDALFEQLRHSFPNYNFKKLDVTEKPINGKFDLVSMIDVTQHITNGKKFSFAMQNVKSALKEKGVFIVTSWLDENARDSYYEKSRSLDEYKREFPDFIFSKPISFRDKFIFTISKRS
jgi:SAM-dependent methyltransferase